MSNLTEQSRNAFELIDKLYLETSYLIKEVEGQMQRMPEEFVILRPSGYGVTTVSSTGLDTKNVGAWLRKRVAVAFAPDGSTELKRGRTQTPFSDELRIMFLATTLYEPDLTEPVLFFGYIENARSKYKGYKKFEDIMWELPTSMFKLFGAGRKIDFEDGSCSMSGEVRKLKLFSIETNEDVRSKLVEPMVRLYRSVQKTGPRKGSKA